MDRRQLEPDYPPRTRVAALRTAELLVITTLRLWVAPLRDPGRDHPDWRGGLEAAGLAAGAAAAFDTLMRILAGCARQRLDVRCPRCPELGADEARCQQLTRALQADRWQVAGAILDLWLPPAAARMAMVPAAGLARALADSGLFIPPPPLAGPPAAAVPHACADRGVLLVH
jgi:hypothetical protein